MTRLGYGTGGALTTATNTAGLVTTFGYDSAHRVISVTRSNGPGTAAVTRFAYPSSSQSLVAQPGTDLGQAVSAVPHTTYTVDSSQRVTVAVDPLNRTRAATYTSLDDVATATTGAGGTTTFSHSSSVDAGESLTGVTAPTGATATLTYGNTGASAFLPSGGTDTQGNAALFTWDGAGNPLSQVNSSNAGATASLAYNGDGTLRTSTDTAGKVTTFTEDAATHQIVTITPPAGSVLGIIRLGYDQFDRVASVTDGRGVTTSYSYDLLDRVKTVGYAPSVAYTYDTAGNVKTRSDGVGTVTYGYDGLNRLTSRSATTGGGTLSWAYDPAGNLTSSTNGGGTTTYTYNDGNQLTSMSSPRSVLSVFGYNADGKRVDTWWKANSSAHTSFAAHTHTDFDASGRVARTWTSRASADTTKVFDTTYCYNTYLPGTAAKAVPAPTRR